MRILTRDLYSNFYTPSMNFLKNSKPVVRHVGERLVHAGILPSSMVVSILDGIMGAKDAIKFIFGGASDFESWNSARVKLGCLEKCLSNAFRHSISIINIHSKFLKSPPVGQLDFTKERGIKKLSICIEGQGFLTQYLVHKVLRDYARSVTNNNLAAKLTYMIMIPTAVVTRITDLAIGILAAVVAFCWLGTQPSINHLAFRGLQITGIFNDLFVCGAKLVNSKAGW